LKKEALMALLAELPDGLELRIPGLIPIGPSGEENAVYPRWNHRLLDGAARLLPIVAATALMLIMIGCTILGARWLAAGGNLDQTGTWGVIADHQEQRPEPAV